MLSSYKPASTERFEDYFDGVPQGTPLSPLLSILALEDTIMARRNAVMYADDGLLFGGSPRECSFPRGDLINESGITLNKSKSG